MRRFVYLLLPAAVGLLLVITAVLSATLLAQPKQPPIEPPPQMAIAESSPETLSLERVSPAVLPNLLQAGAAADSCSEATPILENLTSDGGLTIMNNMTLDPTDPNLQSCMWGNASSPQGYRTVWYKFTAPRNGTVRINTFDSEFDTVLAVYEVVGAVAQPCDSISQNLAMVTCNDDQRGLASEVHFAVHHDRDYLIEIADRQSGIEDETALRISAIIDPIESLWDVISTPENRPGPLTRHAVVSDGSRYLYILGGQTTLNSTPTVSRRLLRYDTHTNEWDEMQPLPGTAGLSNTTAVYLQGKIFLPGGYNGNNQLFDGTHWVYDVATNSWSNNVQSIGESPGGWPVGNLPFAWATAVSSGNDQYHLLGGLTSSLHPTSTERILNTFYTYSTTAGQWFVRTPMPTPRYAHTGAILGNGDICVVGGLSGDPVNGLSLPPNGVCWRNNSWQDIASLNHPRYNAASAVGPDGNWYIFGGISGTGERISTSEMYDPVTNTWVELNIAYDLGATLDLPARAWPRGAFVGQNLWMIGGDYFDFQGQRDFALDIMERIRIFLPENKQNLPFVGKELRESNNTFRGASHLPLNQGRRPGFGTEDFFDTFFFDVPSTRNITVRLEVPPTGNYDVAVYDSNKTLWGESKTPFLNTDETIMLNNLAPGRYYILVSRIHPISGAGDRYKIVVEG